MRMCERLSTALMSAQMCWEADALNSDLRVAASSTRLRADSLRLRLLLLSARMAVNLSKRQKA